jgi:hypothetical protein
VPITAQHLGAGFEPENMELFFAEAARIATGGGQKVELDISSNHLSDLDLGGYETPIERC